MSAFKIGQPIFVFSNKNQTILPGIINAINRCEELSGESVSYKVLIGPPSSPKAKILDLSKIDGEVYNNLEEVKEMMMKKFSDFVDEICLKAENYANEWYNNIEIQNINQTEDGKVDPASLMKDINTNTPQYINIQGNQAFLPNQQPPNANQQQYYAHNYNLARKQLQNNLTDNSGNPVHYIQMNDGTVREVPINITNPKK
jgi:hypothetical protein